MVKYMEKRKMNKLKKAFDIMIGDNIIKLSELGKMKLDEPCCNEPDKSREYNHSKRTWHINSVNVGNELEIVSDDHYIISDCPIEWFEFEENE